MFSQRSLKRGLLFAAMIFGSMAVHAQGLGICDANDPWCVPGGAAPGGGVDPNPYDPNNPEVPGYPSDFATRTILLGQQLSNQAIDVNALLAGALDDLPGFYLDSVEIEVARADRNTVIELAVNRHVVDSARPRTRRVTLQTGIPADLSYFGEDVRIGVRGRAFIREIRFHLVRGY